MKASEAAANGYICPDCGGELTHDHKGRGFVRHKYPKPNGELCPYGRDERDDPED